MKNKIIKVALGAIVVILTIGNAQAQNRDNLTLSGEYSSELANATDKDTNMSYMVTNTEATFKCPKGYAIPSVIADGMNFNEGKVIQTKDRKPAEYLMFDGIPNNNYNQLVVKNGEGSFVILNNSNDLLKIICVKNDQVDNWSVGH